MIVTENNNYTTNCVLPQKAFSIEQSKVAFDILSAKLYSNPALAVVRELLSNAYESQLINGNPDTPIKMHFSQWDDETFYIRDYGTGLSKDDILNLYTTFFKSTKSNTNEFTGGFGLGSKTPFILTDSFSVTSWFEGIKYNYIVTKADGYPKIIFVNDEASIEPSGMQIAFHVDKEVSCKLLEEASKYLSVINEIKVNTNVKLISDGLEYSYTKGRVTINLFDDTNYLKTNRFFVKQGQNYYDLTRYMLNFGNTGHPKRVHLIYNVPVGTLTINPNRESIIENKKLEDVKEEAIRYLYDNLPAMVDEADDKFKYMILALMLNVEKDKMHCLSLKRVHFGNEKIVRAVHKGIKCRTSTREGIFIKENSKDTKIKVLIFNDAITTYSADKYAEMIEANADVGEYILLFKIKRGTHVMYSQSYRDKINDIALLRHKLRKTESYKNLITFENGEKFISQFKVPKKKRSLYPKDRDVAIYEYRADGIQTSSKRSVDKYYLENSNATLIDDENFIRALFTINKDIYRKLLQQYDIGTDYFITCSQSNKSFVKRFVKYLSNNMIRDYLKCYKQVTAYKCRTDWLTYQIDSTIIDAVDHLKDERLKNIITNSYAYKEVRIINKIRNKCSITNVEIGWMENTLKREGVNVVNIVLDANTAMYKFNKIYQLKESEKCRKCHKHFYTNRVSSRDYPCLIKYLLTIIGGKDVLLCKR